MLTSCVLVSILWPVWAGPLQEGSADQTSGPANIKPSTSADQSLPLGPKQTGGTAVTKKDGADSAPSKHANVIAADVLVGKAFANQNVERLGHAQQDPNQKHAHAMSDHLYQVMQIMLQQEEEPRKGKALEPVVQSPANNSSSRAEDPLAVPRMVALLEAISLLGTWGAPAVDPPTPGRREKSTALPTDQLRDGRLFGLLFEELSTLTATILALAIESAGNLRAAQSIINRSAIELMVNKGVSICDLLPEEGCQRPLQSFFGQKLFQPAAAEPEGLRVIACPECLGFNGRNFYIDCSAASYKYCDDSTRLGAWLLEPTTPYRGITVLHLHGIRTSRADPDRSALYRVLNKAGLRVCTIDYRGFADSSNVDVLNAASTRHDTQLAIDWLQRQMNPQEKLVVWGHSLGTAIAVLEVSRRSTLPNNPVKALILESAFNNIEGMVDAFYRRTGSELFSNLLTALLKTEYAKDFQFNLGCSFEPGTRSSMESTGCWSEYESAGLSSWSWPWSFPYSSGP